jgi:hypothetical protein
VVRHDGDATLSWGPNAIYILKKANLIPYDKAFKFRAVKKKDKCDHRYECVTSTGTFTLAMVFFVQQQDGHNCGPIAVCKIMDLFQVEGFSLPKNDFEKEKISKNCLRMLPTSSQQMQEYFRGGREEELEERVANKSTTIA